MPSGFAFASKWLHISYSYSCYQQGSVQTWMSVCSDWSRNYSMTIPYLLVSEFQSFLLCFWPVHRYAHKYTKSLCVSLFVSLCVCHNSNPSVGQTHTEMNDWTLGLRSEPNLTSCARSGNMCMRTWSFLHVLPFMSMCACFQRWFSLSGDKRTLMWEVEVWHKGRYVIKLWCFFAMNAHWNQTRDAGSHEGYVWSNVWHIQTWSV